MPYKDPERQKEYQRTYQREYQRLKRSGEKPTVKTLNPEDIQTARGLLELLTSTITEVSAAKGDVFMKARLKGYLISIGLKCVETADLESRIAALENTGGNTNEH